MIYKCAYCGKQYLDIDEAKTCEEKCQEAAEKAADQEAAEAREKIAKAREEEEKLENVVNYLKSIAYNINQSKKDYNVAREIYVEEKKLLTKALEKFKAEYRGNYSIDVIETENSFELKITPKKEENIKKNYSGWFGIDALHDLMTRYWDF